MKRAKILYKTVVLLIGITGCVSDKLDVPDVPRESVIIEMRVPGFEIPVTRSIEGSKGEAEVQTLDMLIFDKSTPSAKLIRNIKVTDFTPETSGSEYKVKYRLALTQDEAGAVVIVANASAEVDAALVKHPIGSEKQAILEALKFSTSADKDGSYKWNVAIPGYTPIPMYGEVSVDGIAPGGTVNAELLRMLARIDVENEVKGSIFKLEKIYLVSYNTSGYVAPAWDASNGILIPNPYADNKNPMIPNPAGKQAATLDAAMEYGYKQEDDVAGALLAGEIYTYEAVKTAKDDVKNGTCLILGGKYLGKDYFYRVDFTQKMESPATVEFMPLYRNHKYVVSITSVEGIGYETFESALHSSTVLSNLKTTILVVDMAGINNIVYDGQFFMGTESRLLDMPYGVTRQLHHRVSSDYHGEWKAEVLNAGGTTWLTFPGNKSVMNGVDINQTGLDLVITAISAPGGGNHVNGKIVFTAGRLCDTLTVRRVPIADLFARSNVVQKSGVLTFAVTEEDNQTIPAWSQGVFFKWGSLVAMAPAGNPYDPVKQVVYYPSGLNPSDWEGGLTGWDRIPYAHPNFSFTTPSLSGDDADAFKEYSGNTGFNEGAGVGDICRYISSGTGGKGWVEGKWRMPTYAELKQLYDETGVKTAQIGTFTDKVKVLDLNPDNYRNGTFNPESGQFLGVKVAASTPTESNMKPPPSGTVFLPVAGQRYPNGNGNVYHAGAYGYYWSATPYTVNSRYTVNYLFLGEDEVIFYDADRSYAFPVRCIKEY